MVYSYSSDERAWQLLVDDTWLVIFKSQIRFGNDHNLVGVRADQVRWSIGGLVGGDAQYDGIVNVWIKDGAFWAGTWSGYALRFDPRTGTERERVFLK